LLSKNSITGDTNEAVVPPLKKTVEEQLEDLKFAIELDVEYLLINELDSIEGIIEIKKHIALANSKIKLLVKVDNKWAVSEIDSYISVPLFLNLVN